MNLILQGIQVTVTAEQVMVYMVPSVPVFEIVIRHGSIIQVRPRKMLQAILQEPFHALGLSGLLPPFLGPQGKKPIDDSRRRSASNKGAENSDPFAHCSFVYLALFVI